MLRVPAADLLHAKVGRTVDDYVRDTWLAHVLERTLLLRARPRKHRARRAKYNVRVQLRPSNTGYWYWKRRCGNNNVYNGRGKVLTWCGDNSLAMLRVNNGPPVFAPNN